MRDYKLGFISNEKIFEHVKRTVQEYRTSINLASFNRNIVDPIKLTFDSKIYGKSFEETIADECLRQIDKSNTNKIGYFHQNLFAFADDGWEVPREGFDLLNRERHIYVEMKNKHNTMNAASSQKTYMKMQNQLLVDDKALCLLVEVIAKRSQDVKWKTSVDKQSYSHDRIRKVSIDRFYDIVFQDKLAFYKLCVSLPIIFDDVLEELSYSGIENSVYDELSELSPNLFGSLFRFAFRTYEGFDNF